MSNDIEIVTCAGEREAQQPSFHRPFLVECASRRCLAFYARDGTWRNFESGSELRDFVRVMEED
jgi:hypothetical protein